MAFDEIFNILCTPLQILEDIKKQQLNWQKEIT